MAEDAKKTGTSPSGPEQGQFAIQKVYTKDISFETPHAPGVFQKQWQPVVDMNLSNTARPLDKPFYEVVLSVTITVSLDKQTAYLAEVQQAGIFHLSGFPKEVVNQMLGTICPNILFPFAREVVSDLVTRGGFPQLLLAPVNFEALYLQQQASNQLNSKKH